MRIASLRNPRKAIRVSWAGVVNGHPRDQVMALPLHWRMRAVWRRTLSKRGLVTQIFVSTSQPLASAWLLTSANHHVVASISNAASGSSPATMPAPSTLGTPFPFAAALAGKHVKVDLPKPSKFSQIAVDLDIHAWCMHEYLTVSGVEPNVWVVFASSFLDEAPLQL